MHHSSARPPCWLLLALLAGCTGVESTDETTDQGPPAVRVMATWTDEDGQEFFVGRLSCRVERLEPTQFMSEGLTDASGPLVFADLEPGTYQVHLEGEELKATTDTFELLAGHRVTVRVDVEVAQARTERRAGLEFLEDGVLRVLTAPVRLTQRLLNSDLEEEDAWNPQESPSGR
jgi:hypothetical protein